MQYANIQIERQLPYPLTELGAAYVGAGDQLIVPLSMGKRLCKQYPKYMESIGTVEKTKLAQGHYEIVRSRLVQKSPKPVDAEPVATNRAMSSPATNKVTVKKSPRRKAKKS